MKRCVHGLIAYMFHASATEHYFNVCLSVRPSLCLCDEQLTEENVFHKNICKSFQFLIAMETHQQKSNATNFFTSRVSTCSWHVLRRASAC